jgi:hypothetical protein
MLLPGCRPRQEIGPVFPVVSSMRNKWSTSSPGSPAGLDDPDRLCSACAVPLGHGAESGWVGRRQAVLLFNPRTQNWHRHFPWEHTILAGKTKTGIVTVQVLNINDPARVMPAARTACTAVGYRTRPGRRPLRLPESAFLLRMLERIRIILSFRAAFRGERQSPTSMVASRLGSFRGDA